MPPDERPRPGQAAVRREALVVSPNDADGLELRVNFGLFAGREATAAEIDDLGRELVPRIESVTIVSARNHEIGTTTQGTVHQVVVRVRPEQLPATVDEVAELRGRLLEVIERWAQACIADRHDPIGDDLQEPLPDPRAAPRP